MNWARLEPIDLNLWGIEVSIIPVSVGRIAPPKKKTSHRQVLTNQKEWKNGIGMANTEAMRANTIQKSIAFSPE